MLPDGYSLRLLMTDDAPALAAAYDRNRAHLAPWDPERPEDFYTAPGQAESIRAQLALIRQGRLHQWVLWHDGVDDDNAVAADRRIVGRCALNNVTAGVLCSATLGYWVDRDHQGRGLATAMVEFACAEADELGLHRVEAGTMLANLASQSVLRRTGFEHYGTAPSLLYIDGAWRDHHLFQRLLHDRPVGGPFR